MKTSIIIQARLGSKRLPNKVFKKINNKTILEIIYKRLSKFKAIRVFRKKTKS